MLQDCIMEKVAVLHSEPLQFECNDLKQVTEKEAHAPESNSESLPGEGSNQSKDNIHIIDLQEKGYMEYGCQHYQRRCRIRAPCCNEIFDCRICHNETKNDINIDPKHWHDIPRHQLKQVICSLCGTEQEISKQQYHCNGCGICRTGGQEKFFHCYKCGCCQSTLVKNSHICVEGAMHHDCPICFEFLFETRNEVSVMQCGHTIHKSCLTEMRKHSNRYTCPLCSKSVFDMSKVWEKFDIEVAATPMVELSLNKMVWIVCNDCCKTSQVGSHFVGQKCPNCSSYNTRVTRG